MTEGHLLFSIVMSLYIVIAVYIFEEPDLVKEFGSVRLVVHVVVIEFFRIVYRALSMTY